MARSNVVHLSSEGLVLCRRWRVIVNVRVLRCDSYRNIARARKIFSVRGSIVEPPVLACSITASCENFEGIGGPVVIVSVIISYLLPP